MRSGALPAFAGVVGSAAEWSPDALGLLLGAALTLVPTPLLEPRYFTPAVLLFLLHLEVRSAIEEALSAAAYGLVLVGTWYVYFFRPFHHEAHPGLCRFMW